MEGQPTRCRRCLLREMTGENEYYESVKRYRAALPARRRTPDDDYERRVLACRQCAHLDAGTCMQCGCYVEMRAARADLHCPMTGGPW